MYRVDILSLWLFLKLSKDNKPINKLVSSNRYSMKINALFENLIIMFIIIYDILYPQ